MENQCMVQNPGLTFWKKSIGSIINSIWLYTIAGFLSTLSFFPLFIGQKFLFSLIEIVGYILYFVAICSFVNIQQNKNDTAYAKDVRKAYIYLILSILLGWIPLIGWFFDIIFNLLFFIHIFVGFHGLNKSTVLPEEARKGTRRLRNSYIAIFIASIISWVPLIGWVIEGLVSLITFFVILSGWKKLKNNAPFINQETVNIAKEKEAPYPNTSLVYILLFYFSCLLINNAINLYCGPTQDEFLSMYDEMFPIYYDGIVSRFLINNITIKNTLFTIIYLILWSNVLFNKRFRIGILSKTGAFILTTTLLISLIESGILLFCFINEIHDLSSESYTMLAAFFMFTHKLYYPTCLILISHLGMLLMGLGSNINLLAKISVCIIPLFDILSLAFVVDSPFIYIVLYTLTIILLVIAMVKMKKGTKQLNAQSAK